MSNYLMISNYVPVTATIQQLDSKNKRLKSVQFVARICRTSKNFFYLNKSKNAVKSKMLQSEFVQFELIIGRNTSWLLRRFSAGEIVLMR